MGWTKVDFGSGGRTPRIVGSTVSLTPKGVLGVNEDTLKERGFDHGITLMVDAEAMRVGLLPAAEGDPNSMRGAVSRNVRRFNIRPAIEKMGVQPVAVRGMYQMEQGGDGMWFVQLTTIAPAAE